MCGRFALGLSPEKICSLCSYKNGRKILTPKWVNICSNQDFRPSYNIYPGMISPVLISESHFENGNRKKHVICPMKWGLIPYWFKGDVKVFGRRYRTSNCRSETMTEKPTFISALRHGRRCVVLAQGFYEWYYDRKQKAKYPYFVYSSESNLIDESNVKDSLVKMAGLFDSFDDKQGNLLYSFTILTTDSKGSSIESIHNRMPVILNNENEVAKWLDFETYDTSDILNLINSSNQLLYHQVSDKVNKPQHDSIQNIENVSETKRIKRKASNNEIRTTYIKKSRF